MCGIAGILRISQPPASAEALGGLMRRSHEQAIPEVWLDLLDADIRHRGPDGHGRFRDRALRADGRVADIALIHRRLSIIDLRGGAQPMISPRAGAPTPGAQAPSAPAPLLFQGGPREAVAYSPLHHAGPGLVATVFNGCVYNHRPLRAELLAAGHHFASDHSDTEVLLHGWRAWRGELLDRLDAMFALALWDRSAGALVLARDTFGEKPLSILDLTGAPEGLLAFSTGPAGLVRLLGALRQGAAPELNLPALRGWVRFGWGQGSPYRDVHPLPPGYPRAWPADQRPRGGWAWPASLNPERRILTAAQVEAALRQAVHSRLEADVPLGCFLSGGIDSALVASFAAEARPDLLAFTVRMPDPAYDESAAAATTARALGLNHEILDCHAAPADDLVALIGQLGLPFGDSSLLPTHWVSRAARTRVAVALSGDGGDDLFLGYDRHRVMRAMAWASRLPQDAWRALAETPLADGDPRSWRTRLWRLASAAAAGGYKDLLAIFPWPLDEELGLGSNLWAAGGRSQADRGWNHLGLVLQGWGAPVAHQVDTQLRFERLFYLPEDLMRKSDSASMAVALEVRSPFLARDVAEPAMHATVESLMPRRQRKGLLRQIARRRLPAAIVDGPKRGFAIPIGEWFRSDYGGMRTLLLDRLLSREPFGAAGAGLQLNMTCVRRMIAQHLNGERDHSQRLYMLLVLSVWGGNLARA